MPHKPKHPCGYPGCPTLTHNRYCVTHATLRAKQYEQYERDKETWKRYGKEWRTLSKQYLTEHPLCVECEKRGRLTPSHEVHHIIPVKRGGTHESKNLMALCRACHSAITILSGV
jgi:5-methylcytosine-specific restriction protein A